MSSSRRRSRGQGLQPEDTLSYLDALRLGLINPAEEMEALVSMLRLEYGDWLRREFGILPPEEPVE